MKLPAFFLASSVLLVSANVSADQHAPWLADFRKADLNDSDGLSRTELDKSKSVQLQGIKDNFKSIDSDNDGHITQIEYTNFLSRNQDMFAAKFKQADLNDSGGLSRKELDRQSSNEFAGIKKNFDGIDVDKDGQVSWVEYQTHQSAMARAASSVGTALGIPKDGCQPDCGVVVMTENFQTKGSGSAMGAIAGGLAGGALGSQVGKGDGKTVATIGGAVGGAYLGRQLEKKMKTKDMIRVTVKLDNGQQQAFEYEAGSSPVMKGDRVQLVNGQLTRFGTQ
jgi:outer membrane lipoprotein SlyB